VMRKGRAASGAAVRGRSRRDDADVPFGDDPFHVDLPPNASPSAAHEGSDASSSSSSSSSSSPVRTARPSRSGRSLKARALEYLSRREYSRSELARKLAPFSEEGDARDALLNALEGEGWLSDARFTESVVHRRAARMGTNRIVSELRRHSVDDALIQAVGAQLRETERSRAQAVWRKKYGQLPQTPAERAKQARFLATRGFSHETIAQVLKGDDDWGDH
jgi:regulatory protein